MYDDSTTAHDKQAEGDKNYTEIGHVCDNSSLAVYCILMNSLMTTAAMLCKCIACASRAL